ncbi:MAG: hypothetical protein IANPNBLG_00995 [Bryobacteraceae bacterium]|nr:hypothetical protein [Bryobacteraceae bacterium]
MALWKDGSTPKIADLTRYERGVIRVASVESIDLQDKIDLARREAGTCLKRFLESSAYASNADSAMDRVVITEPLARWVTMLALSLAYREAHFSNLSERYQGKWEEYKVEAARIRDEFFLSGVGCVSNPLERPGIPVIEIVAGDGPADTYYAATAWVDSSGNESEASDISVAVLSQAGSSIEVFPGTPPPPAVAWNVYAGHSDTELKRQNSTPLGVANRWTVPAAGLADGPEPSTGQPPDHYVHGMNYLRRG